MAATVLRGVRSADGTVGDLAFDKGRLIDPADAGRGARRIDAAGLMVLPGLVDLHTHLREPGREDAETVRTGTLAAARGGYTACFAMPNTDPVADTAEAVRRLAALGRRDGAAEVIPVGAITYGLAGRETTDFQRLHEAAGVTVFSDDGRCVRDAAVMRAAFQAVRRFGGVLAQHSQDDDLAGPRACCGSPARAERLGLPEWPAVAESAIVARDVQLAQDSGGALHVCHVSTAESVEILRWAKARGLPVTAEATPHHLLLGAAAVETLDTVYKVNPPLRDDEDAEALRAGLADGAIDAVATDHAPHAPADKALPFPEARPGMIGLEQSLAAVMETMILTGRLSWPALVQRMSAAPARIGGAADRQGRRLAVGEPAAFVLIDPTRRTLVNREDSLSKSRNNPYHGLDLPDPVVLTCWRGQLTYDGLAAA
ncbi:MAG: dihydroorotase [Propionibacteriaceae bacterium]|nr:dihydroorotase [Propionibacteriaceae bacterium]